MKQNTSELKKTKLKLQQQKGIKNPLKVLSYEFLGNILIVFSGVLPFVHVLVPDKPLAEKFFGYTSVHRFLYSAGTHTSVLFLTLGIFIVIYTLRKKENINTTLKYLKLSIMSPFMSAIFFISWVFIPNVDYNLLTYTFFGILIVITGILILFKVKEYLQYLTEAHEYRELIVAESLEFISEKLEKR